MFEKVESPPKGRAPNQRIDWVAAISTMKSNPREWHLLGEFSPGIAHWVRQGWNVNFIDRDSTVPPKDQMAPWEFTSRRVAPHATRVYLYGRYVGG